MAYGFLLNFVTSLVFFAQLANDTNMVWVALAFAVPIPYNIFAVVAVWRSAGRRSEEHTSELQSRRNLVCRLLLEKKK